MLLLIITLRLKYDKQNTNYKNRKLNLANQKQLKINELKYNVILKNNKMGH